MAWYTVHLIHTVALVEIGLISLILADLDWKKIEIGIEIKMGLKQHLVN